MGRHQNGFLCTVLILAAHLNGWVSAKTLDLLPKHFDKRLETSEKNFPDPLPKLDSFRGQQFNVSFVEHSLDFSWVSKEGTRMKDGPVVQFLQTLENRTGIIINKKAIPTYDKMARALAKGEDDFTVTFLYYTIQRMRTLDTTAAVVVGQYCFVVKRAPFFSFGMVLLAPYETSTWMTVLLSLCVFTFFWYVVQDFRTVRGRYIKISSDGGIMHAVLDVVELTLTNSCTRDASTNAQRVALIVAVVFILVVSNGYSGQLLGLLANPPRLKDPQTLQEAARIVDSVYIAQTLKPDLESANENGVLTELINKTRPITSDLFYIFQKMVKDGKEGAITSSRHFLYLSNYKELMDKGGRVLHRVPECFFTPGHHSFLIRRNSPFYEVLNKVALMSNEGGLFDHWTRSQRHRMDANGVTVPESFSLDELQPLTLEQLSGPFIVLSIAWGIATGIFMLGLLLPRIHRMRKWLTDHCI